MKTKQQIGEQGAVRIITLDTKVRFANRYSVECSRCGGVQGVKTRREAAATMLGHARICGAVVHQGVRDGKSGAVSALCYGTDGTISTSVWNVNCPDCRERRLEVR